MKTIMLDWKMYELKELPQGEEKKSEQPKEIVPSILSECENTDSRIVIHTQNKEQADALIALWDLIRLRDETWRRDGNWKPINGKIRYYILFVNWDIRTYYYDNLSHILTFRTEEIRDEFLEKHRWLIERLLALYI